MTTETRVYNHPHNGWNAESYMKAGGNDYQISTCKHSGGRIVCMARQGEKIENGFTFDLFGGERVTLAEIAGKATENAVRTLHAQGLEAFKTWAEGKGLQIGEDSKPAYEIKPGQLLYFKGYGNDNQPLAVYEIKEGGTGKKYSCVNLVTLQMVTHSHIRPIEKLFGIGIYYKEGDVIGAAELEEALSKAREKAQKDAEEKAAREARQAEDRARKIEEGRPLVNVPAGAVGLIVAELHQDTSDPQTDYFGYSVEKEVFLAYTFKKREDFKELRKAARNFESTAELAEAGEDFERRENYSGGAGYYLGKSKYSGWNVSKMFYGVDFSNPAFLERLYIAAAEGRYFCPSDQQEGSEAPNIEEVETEPGEVSIIKYGEKAVAVVGDTRKIKDYLKAAGGRFNPRLSCGPGWIFPATRLNQAKEAVSKGLLKLRAESAPSSEEVEASQKDQPEEETEVLAIAS